MCPAFSAVVAAPDSVERAAWRYGGVKSPWLVAFLGAGTHLFLDAHKGVLARPRDPDGAFGEPAFWIFPPPLCRRLRERGAGKVIVEGPRRQDAAPIAHSLIELALGSAPLQQTTVVRWTSSS